MDNEAMLSNPNDGSILLVDDDREVRDLLKVILRALNRPLREAEDGLDALEQVAQTRPALIILDVMMPRMTGTEMLRRLRSDPATADIPVVLFTAVHLSEKERDELRLDPALILRKGCLGAKQVRDVVMLALESGHC